ncbi:MAG TPA: DUF3108 domain-containing protein [Flavobacteriaceae bacterium]|nr:DUF3108 domain-containing protein [Flavobacteriaceae bacterium]
MTRTDLLSLMKKFTIPFVLLCLLFFPPLSHAQNDKSTYQDGEWIKLRIHYGWFNASYATLEVKEKMIGDTPVYHVKGRGKSTGLLHAFFKVDDTYESTIDKKTELPIQFKRDINEGGHTKNKILWFNQRAQTAKVRDLKHNTTNEYETNPNVQDMISAFYYARNQIADNLKEPGDELIIDMFYDEKNYKFKTVYLGREVIKTKFGRIETLKLRPYVQAGRVFKEQEGLTVWLSADKNKIPIKVRAKLAVGSLTASLEDYKGLKYPLQELKP